MDARARERLEMWRHNRIVLARRLSWPPGAMNACDHVERDHPGWTVMWQAASTVPGWERPAGFCATRDGWSVRVGHGWRRVAVYAPAVAELVAEMELATQQREAEEAEHERFSGWLRGA